MVNPRGVTRRDNLEGRPMKSSSICTEQAIGFNIGAPRERASVSWTAILWMMWCFGIILKRFFPSRKHAAESEEYRRRNLKANAQKTRLFWSQEDIASIHPPNAFVDGYSALTNQLQKRFVSQILVHVPVLNEFHHHCCDGTFVPSGTRKMTCCGPLDHFFRDAGDQPTQTLLFAPVVVSSRQWNESIVYISTWLHGGIDS